jgi:hypothetical protein
MLNAGTKRTHGHFHCFKRLQQTRFTTESNSSWHFFRIVLLTCSYQFSKLSLLKTTSFQDSFAGGMRFKRKLNHTCMEKLRWSKLRSTVSSFFAKFQRHWGTRQRLYQVSDCLFRVFCTLCKVWISGREHSTWWSYRMSRAAPATGRRAVPIQPLTRENESFCCPTDLM